MVLSVWFATPWRVLRLRRPAPMAIGAAILAGTVGAYVTTVRYERVHRVLPPDVARRASPRGRPHQVAREGRGDEEGSGCLPRDLRSGMPASRPRDGRQNALPEFQGRARRGEGSAGKAAPAGGKRGVTQHRGGGAAVRSLPSLYMPVAGGAAPETAPSGRLTCDLLHSGHEKTGRPENSGAARPCRVRQR